MDSASSVPGPQVHYTFNKVLMLQEPLLVVATFYILFFTVIVYVRLDFSITKVPPGHLRAALGLRPSGPPPHPHPPPVAPADPEPWSPASCCCHRGHVMLQGQCAAGRRVPWRGGGQSARSGARHPTGQGVGGRLAEGAVCRWQGSLQGVWGSEQGPWSRWFCESPGCPGWGYARQRPVSPVTWKG